MVTFRDGFEMKIEKINFDNFGTIDPSTREGFQQSQHATQQAVEAASDNPDEGHNAALEAEDAA